MAGILYKNISCLVSNSGLPASDGVRPTDKDLGIVSRGAVAWNPKKRLVEWSGPTASVPRAFRDSSWRPVNCSGLTAYPGLVDCHTHPIFSGDRSREFQLRMLGASYQDIAAAGGGIISSMRSTRASTSRQLSELICQRLRQAEAFGVRLLEAKSGYGLNVPDEIKGLSALKAAAKSVSTVEVYATCLAAHAIPPEFLGRSQEYVNLVCEKIIPEVKKKRLAQSVDVFCDEGYFSLAQTRTILEAAKSLGLATRVHGEELSLTGAAELAADAGALSVDHLLKVSPAGIKRLSESRTIAVLLPGTALYLREPPAPARALIDAGARVAIASDFNPGSCPTQNLPLIGTLAALHMMMTTAEIIVGLTWNAASALASQGRFGALLPGYRGGPVFSEGDHPSALFYRMAPGALPVPR